MIKVLLSTIITCLLCYTPVMAQHIYYKHVDKEILNQFVDTANKVVFVKKYSKDSVEDLSKHFTYMLRFFHDMEFEKITVVFKPSQRVARIKPTFKCLFQSPKKRKYKIIFSTRSNATLDSVLINTLHTNEQLGLIARQLGYIQDLSTDGFFDLVGWHFKQLARKPRKRLEHENELKVLELGCGYQMLALSRAEDQKLKIENWHNARAYTKYVKHYRNEFMSPAGILNFIKDMPVYVTHKYK